MRFTGPAAPHPRGRSLLTVKRRALGPAIDGHSLPGCPALGILAPSLPVCPGFIEI